MSNVIHFFERLFARTAVHPVTGKRRRPSKPRFESLEDRCVPAVVVWDGDAEDGLWETGLNWDGDVVPGAGDDAVVPEGYSVVSNAAVSVGSISLLSPVIFNGDLTLAYGYAVNANVVFNGDLTLGGSLDVGFLSYADATFNGDVHIAAGVELRFTGGLGHTFAAGITIDGDGLVAATGSWLTFLGDASVSNLDIVDTRLIAGGEITVTGIMNVAGASSLEGDGEGGGLVVQDELNFLGGDDKEITDFTITNQGIANWTEGKIVGGNATFNNQAGAVFNAQEWATDWEAGGQFNNDGEFNSEASHIFWTVFNSSNVVNLLSGTLELVQGGQFAGTAAANLATTLLLTAGNFDLLPGFTFTGSGVLIVRTNTWVFGTVVATNFDLRSGRLDGPGTLLITNQMNWTGGNMENTGGGTGTTEIATGAALLIDANVSCIRWTIRNRGLTTLNTARRLTLDVAVLDNYRDLVLVDAAQMRRTLNPIPATLINRADAIIRKTELGSAEIQCEVDCAGSVIVEKGDLSFYNNGVYAGPFNVSDDATITFTNINFTNPSVHNFQAGSTFTNTGAVALSGTRATMAIAANHTLRMDRFSVSGSFFNEISGGTVSARVFEWNAGKITDCVVNVYSGESLAIGAEQDCALDDSWIHGYGLVEWMDNDLFMDNGSRIEIFFKFKIRSDGDIAESNTSLLLGSIDIAPGGLMQKTAGDNNNIGALVTNTNGTLDLNGGSQWLTEGYVCNGGVTYVGAAGFLGIGGQYQQFGQSAVFELFGGQMQATSCEISAGEFRLGGGGVVANMNLLGGSPGGVLVGSGMITGTVVNSGRIRIFSNDVAGTVNIVGSYTQASAGVLEIHATAQMCDRLTVSGNVNLDGTVEFSAEADYSPPPGTASLTILLYSGTRQGTFAVVVPAAWTADYTEDGKVVLRN